MKKNSIEDYVLGFSVEMPDGYHVERQGISNEIRIYNPDRKHGVSMTILDDVLLRDYESTLKTVSSMLIRTFERVK